MNQRERVLSMLKNAGRSGVTTGEFLDAYLPRFGARIYELRRAGMLIDQERLSSSSWRYTLRGGPVSPTSSSPERGGGARGGMGEVALAAARDSGGNHSSSAPAVSPTLFEAPAPSAPARPTSHHLAEVE